jgi:hypothetical protein
VPHGKHIVLARVLRQRATAIRDPRLYPDQLARRNNVESRPETPGQRCV